MVEKHNTFTKCFSDMLTETIALQPVGIITVSHSHCYHFLSLFTVKALSNINTKKHISNMLFISSLDNFYMNKRLHSNWFFILIKHLSSFLNINICYYLWCWENTNTKNLLFCYPMRTFQIVEIQRYKFRCIFSYPFVVYYV